jgi:hypothetical protein
MRIPLLVSRWINALYSMLFIIALINGRLAHPIPWYRLGSELGSMGRS